MNKIKLSDIHEFVLENAKCNFHCAYCHSGYTENDNGHLCKPIIFNKQWFDENLIFDHSEKINLWGGEPFANWNNYKEVIEYFEPHTNKITFISNGSLFDEEKADYLLKHKCYVHFSHDLAGQDFRGTDFLKTDDFKKAATIIKSKRPKWRIALRKVYHGKTPSFDEDIKYLEDISTNYLPEFNFKILVAFGRGFEKGDEYIWKAEDMLTYFRDMMKYIVDNGKFAKDFAIRNLDRNLILWDIQKNKSFDRILCPPTKAYFNNVPFTLGSTGHLSHCHCYAEFPRKKELRETCAKCHRKGYCMGACLVTDNSAQCEEWAKFYDGLYELTDEYINKYSYDYLKGLTI